MNTATNSQIKEASLRNLGQISESNNAQIFLDDLNSWKPLDRFVQDHDQFQLSQLRWLLRDRKGNGLDKAVRKVGKRIYIHDQLFADWILKND